MSVSLPLFSGSLHQWLDRHLVRVGAFFRVHAIDNDAERLDMLALSLLGEAELYYATLTDSELAPTTYEAAVDLLRQRAFVSTRLKCDC